MVGQRVVRSREGRKAEIEKKIRFHKDRIKTLKQKVHDVDSPKTFTRSKGMRRILTESRFTDDETAEILGFKDTNEMRAKPLAAAETKDE